MKKYHIILLLFLGVIFTPLNAFACGKDAVKHSCKTEYASKKKMKSDHSCCKKNDNKDKGCNGCCGHSKCGCSSTCQTSVTLPEFFTNDTLKTSDFSFIEKIKFFYTYLPVSDGFNTIWLIPKIG